MTWSQVQTKGHAPGPRLSHAGVLINDSALLIFGGYDGKSRLNDTYLLHLDTMAWSEPLFLGKPPSKRFGHGAASVGNLAIIFGGDDGSFDRSILNDIHIFDYGAYNMLLLGPRCFHLSHSPPVFLCNQRRSNGSNQRLEEMRQVVECTVSLVRLGLDTCTSLRGVARVNANMTMFTSLTWVHTTSFLLSHVAPVLFFL
jgi:hypothetical protein